MGQQHVDSVNQRDLRAFTRAVLSDLRALETMLAQGRFETGVRRIGAEQEMFLVDAGARPAPKVVEVLKTLNNPAFTTELAKFNLEANLPPYVFGGACLSEMHAEIDRLVGQARSAAEVHGARVLLGGILPTLQMSDLGLNNMTPVPRYLQLNDALLAQAGGQMHIGIKGTDELSLRHDNVMLEACNTSFQVHFQVAPHEFANLYNLAQAVTAPVLAAGVNSPVLLGKRLWRETRVALFQHSVDDRNSAHRARGRRARVRFGDKWVQRSVTELFKDDIARFRVLLGMEVEEDANEVLARGGVPTLAALRLHNGTIYRWNRPCYGVTDGVPHLRIECRVLPAGPTVLDEVANAAFFFGLMCAVDEEYGDITRAMAFDDARSNFVAAAREGLQAQFRWVGGKQYAAAPLILDHLLPLARAGLESRSLAKPDIDRYLGVLEERVRRGRTGASWVLGSLAKMPVHSKRDERMRALADGMIERQQSSGPGHDWTLANLDLGQDWRHSYHRVGQYMTDDLYTLHPEDLVDLAANLMDWAQVRDIPVEDGAGRLVGMVTHRMLLRLMAQGPSHTDEPVAVHEVMDANPAKVTPETSTLEAIRLLRQPGIKGLPVVEGDHLVGMVTEREIFDIATRLLEQELRAFEEAP
jgi:CBS domain-containing protein